MSTPRLQASLDSELPSEIEVGRGTAVFVTGTCFCPDAEVRSLSLLVDGAPQPLMGQRMPRLDFFAELHPKLDPYETASLARDPDSEHDPAFRAYRSGFWGLATFPLGTADGDCDLGLVAELEGGGTATVSLARIRVRAGVRKAAAVLPAAVLPAQPGSRLVAIAMATYNPPRNLLQAQLDSIRSQTHENWVCVISDDCSRPEALERLRAEIAGDPRFVLSRSPRRLGFYRNFERALAMVPPEAEFVAMADQDDRWYPDKLRTLLARIGDARLVYSDARIVAADGTPIAETYWEQRRNNHSSLLSLLVANSVTGAASLLRRDVLDHALPFPPAQFHHYHDHWVGLVALALGDIEFVERPLYDYVQHRQASLGHAAANRMTALRDRVRDQRPPRDRVRMWRLHYFVDVCRLMQVATILKLRCGSRMSARKRRELSRFLDAEHSPRALAALAARGARELAGTPETLGAEWMLFHAFAWRRLLERTATDRPGRRFRVDAVPPPSLVMAPGSPASVGVVGEVEAKIAPLELVIDERAPMRINVLIPTIDLAHFFGGYIAKFNLAARLAAAGLRVRLVTVDPVGALPPQWQRSLESYSGLEGLFDRVEVAFGRGPAGLEVSPADRFIASTWWSAHIAAAAVRELGGERFVYLIQEYEPFTFPMGSYAALAEQSYRFPHYALFSSELLRDYFRRHAIGVFAGGVGAGDQRSSAFQNAITPVTPPAAAELASRDTRRLLFYARPEPHAARNMFELGVLGLSRAARDGAFDRDWELHGIGSVSPGRQIPLHGDLRLDVLPRSDQGTYANVLRDHDLGLALMYTPHPSLVPLEMASAGMLTVTNSFENKTPAALGAISTNLIAVEPTIDAIAAGLIDAAAAVADHERRARGARVAWSRDWLQSFDSALLARVARALGLELGAAGNEGIELANAVER